MWVVVIPHGIIALSCMRDYCCAVSGEHRASGLSNLSNYDCEHVHARSKWNYKTTRDCGTIGISCGGSDCERGRGVVSRNGDEYSSPGGISWIEGYLGLNVVI